MQTTDSPPLIACTPVNGMTVSVRKIGQVAGGATLATSPPNDGRLFVLQQTGEIRVFENEMLNPAPFLDINQAVTADPPPGERGLLGLAFHPHYAENGLFYVAYTTSNADVVARYKVSADDYNKADPASGQIIISIPDFAANHNGSMLEFGSDGFLYYGTGDGGGGGDPFGNGQNPHALLGKLLRLDVDHKSPGMEYGIPPTNPFADGIGGAPEAYLIGARNPWRWSFDRLTKDLWIGDVGQGMYEELDVIPAGTPPGANLGWNMYEGKSCFQPPCDPTNITMPIVVKDHAIDGWCAIIGGDVYRGDCYPDIQGTYFFTDYCAHVLGTVERGHAGDVVVGFPDTQVAGLMTPAFPGFPVTPTSLHADAHGELYLATASCCGTSLLGGIYHLEAGP